MKKLFALFTFLIACSFTSVMAQGGPGGPMDSAQRATMLKERIKDLNLTTTQQDSVVAIWTDRSIMEAAFAGSSPMDMTREERQAKMKEIGTARQKRLISAGFTEEQAKKIAEKLSFRPGGGPGGGAPPSDGGTPPPDGGNQ